MYRTVIYIRGRSEEHRELVAALEELNFKVHIVRDVATACELAEKQVPAVCILDASSSDAEVSERLIDLSDATPLFPRPFLFIGRHATTHAHPVMQKFRRFLAVDYPFKLDSLLRRFADESDRSGEITPASTKKSKAELDPTALKSTYGGSVLLSANSLSDFDDELLLPPHPQRERLKKALDAMTQANLWLGLHARRSTFVSSALAHASNLKGKDPVIRTSAMMLNWGLSGSKGNALTLDIFSPRQGAARKKIADAFKVSADVVAEKLEDDSASKLLDTIATVLASPERNLPAEQRDAAECVLLVEASDRVCWRYGHFDHFGASRILRAIRSTPLVQSKPLADGMSKIIAEAVLRQDPNIKLFSPVLSKRERVQRRKSLDLARREGEDLFSGVPRREINLFDLVPGMKLASPLVSLDGYVLLPAATTMDRDTIHRIFQLAAIRPLKNPVSILR